jgi:hypothetical protein
MESDYTRRPGGRGIEKSVGHGPRIHSPLAQYVYQRNARCALPPGESENECCHQALLLARRANKAPANLRISFKRNTVQLNGGRGFG